ncbi:sensor histidine kinase [Paenibacillus turpanensis]|uniref:sensor histidine kinase n=1 Tax=Paenibacillus turpanensis TaxID=2689078 RepID=UPI00140A1151|nr:ATP-binding protein [Paenibacillus turpanensis]
MIDFLKEYILIVLLATIPNVYISTLFSFCFWGHPLRNLWKTTLIYATTVALYSNFMFLLLPPPWRPIHFLAALFVFFWVAFRWLPTGERIRIFTLSAVSNILIEIIGGTFVMAVSANAYGTRTAAMLLLSMLPGLLTASVLTYLMIKHRWYPGIKISNWLTLNKKSRTYLHVSTFIVVQLLLVLFVLVFSVSNLNYWVYLIVCLIAAVGVLIIYKLLMLVTKEKDAAVGMTQQLYIDDVNQMFTAIRGQRHDFLNHVQVLQAMLQRKKFEDLDRYLGELVGEIKDINDIIGIGDPAFAALVQSKLTRALDKKIDFRFSFHGLDQLRLGVKTLDIVKISGNLIDNAFDEVEKLESDLRWVDIRGWIEENELHLEVSNPGKLISEAEKELLFFPGYSTKGTGVHSGLGLSIVKECIERYNGRIEVTSCPEGGNTFGIVIPMTFTSV